MQSWKGEPGYRPPMAEGQQYPPLGYSADGSPRYVYGDPRPAPQNVAVAEPPAPEPERPQPPQRTALGVVAVIVLVLAVVGGLKLMSNDDDDPVTTRSEPPASQNVDDPYLPKSIEPTETVPGETSRPAQSGLTAELSVDAAPGSRVLYIDDDAVRIAELTSSHWTQTITSRSGILRVNVVVRQGSAASCTITVDGQTVDHQELAEDDPSGILVCRANG